MAEKLLAQAIDKMESGDIDSGRDILLDILQEDDRNELAWLWLSKTYTDDRVKYCLQKVLKINPNSQAAKAELAKHRRENHPNPEADVVEAEIMPEGKLVFIPNATNVFILRLLPLHLIVACIIISSTYYEGLRIFGFLVVLVYILMIFAFCLRVLSPFYHIEVYDEYLVAPTKVPGGWKRVSTPLDEIILENLERNYHSFGFYTLYTVKYKRILLAGFMESQYLELLDVIRGRKVF